MSFLSTPEQANIQVSELLLTFMDLNKQKIIMNLSFNFHFNYCPVINLRQASQFAVQHIKSVFKGSGSVCFLGVVIF